MLSSALSVGAHCITVGSQSKYTRTGLRSPTPNKAWCKILKSCSWIRCRNIWNSCTADVTTRTTCASLPRSRLQYGIVLDAGSSHTSVYIYEWPAEKDNNTGRVAQRHVCQVKGKGCTILCGCRRRWWGDVSSLVQSEKLNVTVIFQRSQVASG